MSQTILESHRRTTRQIIKSFEAKALKKRALIFRLADLLTKYFGTPQFLIYNLAIFVVWIGFNSRLIPGIEPFDPFPFILLTMTVSLEAIVLTIIVLMSQNRQSIIATLRDELQLQVNLITERELTKALQLLVDLHEHHKVDRPNDPELNMMLKSINTSYIEKKLEEQLATDQPHLHTLITNPLQRKPTHSSNHHSLTR